jgi:hypothetical protein
METNMKTKWGILTGCAALALTMVIGCDTDGGSSITDGPGSTNKAVIVQIRLGVPVCSSTGAGALNGAVFNGGAAYLYLSPSCANPADTLFLPIKVLASEPASAIDHYVWTIRNWSSTAPNGMFTADSYDQVLDTNGVFKVRTSANQIRYSSTSAANLLALASLFNQMIDVTVVTKDGRVASGYISLKLHNGTAVGDGLLFGDLSATDSFSNARLGSFADYFSIVGAGTTNVLSLEGDFDTFLALYDTNLNLLAQNDDVIPGLILSSEIRSLLTNGTTYFVEATSSSNRVIGSYSISNNTGALTPMASPFVSGGTCDNVSGTYAVTDVQAINLTFNGQSYTFTNVVSTAVTLVQNDCDFAYLVNDPNGVIPPLVRMGRVDFTSIELYSDTYLPQSPDIFITSSAVTGSGRTFSSGLEIDSVGNIQGTFLGFPFTVTYTSRAAFAR